MPAAAIDSQPPLKQWAEGLTPNCLLMDEQVRALWVSMAQTWTKLAEAMERLQPHQGPVVGSEQADKLRNPSLASNEVIHRGAQRPRQESPPDEVTSRAITRPITAAPYAASAPAGRPRSPPHP